MPRSILVVVASILVTLTLTTSAGARPAEVKPVKAPESLLRARAACGNHDTIVQCRSALRRAYAALEWNRKVRHELRQRLLQAVKPVEHLTSWVCIHEHEGAWNDIADPFWGGLQMDRDFMHTYGPDMITRYSADGTLGFANEWTPREQMIVAERAYDAGRGYAPWPQTSRACGLL